MGAQLIFIRQLLIKEGAVFSKILFVVLQRILIEKIVQRRILSVYVKIAKRQFFISENNSVEYPSSVQRQQSAYKASPL